MFTVSFSGIKDNPSFLADSLTRGIDEGKVVKISANKTVSLCESGDSFRGVIETIDHDNMVCTVKERGYVTLPYSGNAPDIGEEVGLNADGNGGVQTGWNNSTYPVVDVDTDAQTVTFKLLG